LRFRPSFWFEKKSGELKRLSRLNSKSDPCSAFVPDLVTALTDAPERNPLEASCAPS
jgi:hypothetical protein